MFAVWNWKFFITIFFQDSATLGTSKALYIQEHIFNKLYMSWIIHYPLPYWLDSFLSNRFYELVPPAFLTAFILYLLPPLANRVHKDSLRFYFARQLEYHKQNTDYKKGVLESKDAEIEITKEISHKEEEIQSAQKNFTQEEKWRFEYELLIKQNTTINSALQNAVSVIYKNRGYFDPNPGTNTYMPVNYLSLLDSIGAITVNANKINFTEKGKYFVRLKNTS